MTHLSQLRRYRKIATQAVAHYPLTNVKLDYLGFTENVVYKITANEGKFLLRIHAASFRTQNAIKQELAFINLLRKHGGFDLQEPLTSINDQPLVTIDGETISMLRWQDGQKRHKSIKTRHFIILGQYLSKLHQFADENRSQIKNNLREYWTAEKLIGQAPILGDFDGLEAVEGFNRSIFEASRTQTLAKLQQHETKNPNLQGMIHADLHFSNILWRGDNLLPIDFDDCGIGSFLHDLAIPIISIHNGKLQHHRDILLNAYCQTRSLSQNDLASIDDYILARHITMQGWLFARSSHPKIKAYQARGMVNTIETLQASLK